jgi:[NiFe] hydrogenase assembly HybE family chaperone
MSSFEGSFLGDSNRIDPSTRMECGVCWWVYDPGLGDEIWQIAAGTEFSELPSHWRCPNCDASKEQFMVLTQGQQESSQPVSRPARDPVMKVLEDHRRSLAQAYQEVDSRMRKLPVYRADLDIQVHGMRRCQYGYISVAATPWCMNLVLLAEDDKRPREGTSRDLDFPSGSYAFTAGHLPGVGKIESCSLFSPMEAFENPAAVAAVAAHSIEALFHTDVQADTKAEIAPGIQAGVDEPAQPSLSRRQFLRPGASA